MASHREDDFKRGLGSGEDAAQRHGDRAVMIRKQKRTDRMAQRRMYLTTAPPLMAEPFSLERFLGTGHEGDLFALHHFFQQDATVIMVNLPQLLRSEDMTIPKKQTMSLIWKLMEDIHADRHAQLALTILIHMSNLSEESILICMYECRVLPFLGELLPRYAPSVWFLITELVFAKNPSLYLVAANEMHLFNTPHFQAILTDPQYQEVVSRIFCAFFMHRKAPLPPKEYLLKTICPVLFTMLGSITNEATLYYWICSMSMMFERVSSDAVLFYQILLLGEQRRLFPVLVQAIHASADFEVQLIATKILISAQTLKLQDMRFVRAMVDAGAINVIHPCLMMKMQNEESVHWMANLAACHFDLVLQMREAAVFETMCAILRGGSKQNIIVFFTMCLATNIVTTTLAAAPHPEVEPVLFYFLHQQPMTSMLRDILARPGCTPDVILSIMGFWLTLIFKWNREAVIRQLEEQEVLTQVDALTYSNDRRIYKQATRLVELCQGMQDEEDFQF